VVDKLWHKNRITKNIMKPKINDTSVSELAKQFLINNKVEQNNKNNPPFYRIG
jgi:hypothetical protein